MSRFRTRQFGPVVSRLDVSSDVPFHRRPSTSPLPMNAPSAAVGPWPPAAKKRGYLTRQKSYHKKAGKTWCVADDVGLDPSAAARGGTARGRQ